MLLQFPIAVNWQRPTYEIPYGTIERAVTGEEEPGQSWLDHRPRSRRRGATELLR